MKTQETRLKYVLALLLSGMIAVMIISCGGGGGGGTDFTVGGTVTGLSGTLVLQNNGGDDLTITADGTFSFATALADGSAYAVTVLTQPSSQICSVTSGSGTITGADVANVVVTCSSDTYTVGGVVSGLSGTLVLQNNGGDNLTITGNGAFTFATALADGSAYGVTILSQPASQTCAVTNDSGTISGANITTVHVTCSAVNYTLGGSVTGLSGTLVLQNNGVDDLTVTTNGAFTFVTSVADGSPYAVTVLTQPAGETCTVSNGTGTVSGADVTTVAVTCASASYTVGGTVAGLTETLVLQNNGGDNLTITVDGSFTFATPIADGSAFAVTVHTQPIGQICAVTNGSGTVSGANITSITVTCSTAPCNTVNVIEDVTVNTTWTTGNVYVIRAWDFYITATLTIEAGTVIKFHPADGPYAMISGAGKILANGTAADPVVFTSFMDDDHCGDTNGDGAATTPAVSDWYHISTNGAQGSVFNYSEFYYGGGGSYDRTLDLSNSQATVTNCTFAHNDGFEDGALDASDALVNTVVTGNVFYDNVKPIYIDSTFDMDDSNVFHNPANPSEKNTYNGIFLWYPNHFTNHITWEETEVAFVIDDNDLWVNSGATLTLGNDVVLKFMKTGSTKSTLLLGDGESALVNHGGSGVWFTSYKDDTHKGDTNGDGNATSPTNGDWEGIWDDSLAVPFPHFFTWANILYDSY